MPAKTDQPGSQPVFSAVQAPLIADVTTLQCSNNSGELSSEHTEFAPGLFLNADPGLELSGQWRSPPGRFLELEAQTAGAGDWVGLHVALALPDLSNLSHFGFLCRIAAPETHVLRTCLRSGLADGGFIDCFFDKHILATDRPISHMDALYLDACPELPLTAPWCELVLFLPCQPFQISLQHLHIFAF